MAFYANSILSQIEFVFVLSIICLLFGRQSHGQPPYPRSLCPSIGGNYTTNSTYEANLNRLLQSLPANGNVTGYADATVGVIRDRIYGLVLCRGDVESSECQKCLEQVAINILQLCPMTKSAIIWEEKCLLRYANQQFLGTQDGRQLRDFMYNINNITAPAFNATVWRVLDGLARYAVANLSARPPMFGAGESDLSLLGDQTNRKLYGLVQCTQDISRDDCNRCLLDLFDFLKGCCTGRVGAVVLAASCNIRYETYTYFNSSRALVFPPLQLESPAAAGTDADQEDERFEEFESLHFDLSIIKSATSNFATSNILGRGGFGDVYKGLLPNKDEIAVKRLTKSSTQGIKELRNEVVLLAKLQHKNLVRILGVFLEGEEKLLVYEFIKNKSLDKILFDPVKKELLNWEVRYKIIYGIARGLLYLHEESQIKIIHRDLKASNILLDADMNPKISDFGLARLFEEDATHANTKNIAGTFGYMPPEYVLTGQFSTKSDVFGFGVLVLEIVTGIKRTEFSGDEATDLLSSVWKHWSAGKAYEILDPAIANSSSLSEVNRCIQMGLLCVQEMPANRPTMATVGLILDSHSVTIQSPGKPVMFAGMSTASALPVSSNSASSYDITRSSTNESTRIFSENESVVIAKNPR